MQKGGIILLIFLALALMVIACETPAPEPGGLSQEDLAAIDDVLDGYQRALNNGDWNTWSEYWTEDAVYMIPNAPELEGRAAIRESTAGYPPLPDLSIEAEVIDGLGDFAYLRGSGSYTIPDQVTKYVGKFLWILKKQPEGKWQIAIECYNSDLPVSTTQ